MTMIELGVVMSIVAVLLALVLGLSRHVNEVIKIRRAQAELGEWHEALNTWYLQFGMYPDPSAPQFNNPHIESNLLSLASQDVDRGYYVEVDSRRHYFAALMSKRLNTSDPWGTPYFYRSTTNAYELFSCGPNTLHLYQKSDSATDVLFPKDAAESVNRNFANNDDIFFEP